MSLTLLSLPTSTLAQCCSYLPWRERVTECGLLFRDGLSLQSPAGDHECLSINPAFLAHLQRTSAPSAWLWLCNARSVLIEKLTKPGDCADLSAVCRPQALNRPLQHVRRLKCDIWELRALLECGVSFTSLHSLWLTDSKNTEYKDFKPWLFKCIRILPCLRRLKLQHCQLLSADYSSLLSLPGIEFLSTNFLWVDRGEQSLDVVRERSTSLRTLRVESQQKYHRPGLADFLSAFHSAPTQPLDAVSGGLQSLHMGTSFAKSEEIAALAAIRSLTGITLHGQLFPTYLEHFVSADGAPLLPHLVEFDTGHASFKDDLPIDDDHTRFASARFFNAYRQLRFCHPALPNCHGDVLLAALTLPHVNTLELHWEALRRVMPAVASLGEQGWIWRSQVAAASALSHPPALSSLRQLTLSRLPITDHDLPVLLHALPQLRCLSIRHCSMLTVAAWLVLASAADNIVTLELTLSGMHLTEAGWRQAVHRYLHLFQLVPVDDIAAAPEAPPVLRTSPFSRLLARLFCCGSTVSEHGAQQAAPLLASLVHPPVLAITSTRRCFPRLQSVDTGTANPREFDVAGYACLATLLSTAPLLSFTITPPRHHTRPYDTTQLRLQAGCLLQLSRLPHLRFFNVHIALMRLLSDSPEDQLYTLMQTCRREQYERQQQLGRRSELSGQYQQQAEKEGRWMRDLEWRLPSEECSTYTSMDNCGRLFTEWATTAESADVQYIDHFFSAANVLRTNGRYHKPRAR